MDVHGLLGDHRYRLIAFDWDGTAVTDRKEHPAELARAMQRLLDAGSLLVVITGTNADNVGGQIAPLLTPAALSRLYMMVNRGSEVYAHEADGTRSLLWGREASSEEDAALDSAADTVRNRLAADHGIEIDIIRNRLNRRKLDLIPTPEWADPPKARIGELLAAVEERLKPVPGGIGAVIDMTDAAAKAAGLRDPRITTDVKHVEVGLTDKSDSIAYVMRRLAPVRAILPAEVLLAGDEFGPIAGFEGSDYRMVSRLAEGATIVSVGREPNGVPPGVVHLGGGPAAFVELLDAQADLGVAPVPAPPAPEEPAAPLPPPDGWVVERTGYDAVSEASSETLFALGERVHGDSRDGRRGRSRGGSWGVRRGPLRRHDGRSGGPGGDRRLGRQRDLGRRPGPASVGVARPREHPPARPPGAAPRAHAALRRPRRPHVAAPLRAVREPRRPPCRRDPARARTRGRARSPRRGGRRPPHPREPRAAAACRAGRDRERR